MKITIEDWAASKIVVNKEQKLNLIKRIFNGKIIFFKSLNKLDFLLFIKNEQNYEGDATISGNTDI